VASTTQWMMNDLQRGRGQGYVTYFLNFGIPPSITVERKQLDKDTSFFSVRSAVASTTQRTINVE